MCYEQNIDRDSSLEAESFLQMKVLRNLWSWFPHTVESVKTLQFIITYYIETSNHHKHFLDRRATSIYHQYIVESVNKATFQAVWEGLPTLFLSG